MRFWDASAVVPLLVEQPASAAVDGHLASEPGMIVWWGTPVECASALARLLHEGTLDERELGVADAALGVLGAAWYEVQPSLGLRDRAVRLLRVHDLRAADALQLAAALEWSETAEGELVTFDRRLAAAARREGFRSPTCRPDSNRSEAKHVCPPVPREAPSFRGVRGGTALAPGNASRSRPRPIRARRIRTRQEAALNLKREEERERFVAVDPETQERYVIVRSVRIHDASTFGRPGREREGAETLRTTRGLDVNRVSKSEFDVLDPTRGRVRVVRRRSRSPE